MMQNSEPTYFSLLPKWLAWVDILGIFEKDPFGNFLLFKRILTVVLGSITYWRLALYKRIRIEGTEHFENLTDNNILFLSNHQTYFSEVIAFYHIFFSVKWGFKNTIVPPLYLLAPRVRLYYVAASETMKKGLLTRLFSMAGALTVERTWRAGEEQVQRNLDTSAGDKIKAALAHGWVVSFPQGTTKPYAPVRKGAAHLIKANKPIVIPVVVNGFSEAFGKTGLGYLFKNFNAILSVKFKEPLVFAEDETIEEMVNKIAIAIEQVPVSS